MQDLTPISQDLTPISASVMPIEVLCVDPIQLVHAHG